jgi:hypothetical protein
MIMKLKAEVRAQGGCRVSEKKINGSIEQGHVPKADFYTHRNETSVSIKG